MRPRYFNSNFNFCKFYFQYLSNKEVILFYLAVFLLIFGCNEPKTEIFFDDIQHTEGSLIKINNYICLVDSINNHLFVSINEDDINDFNGKVKYPVNYEIFIEDNIVFSNQNYDFGEVTLGEPTPMKIVKNDTIIINYDLHSPVQLCQ